MQPLCTVVPPLDVTWELLRAGAVSWQGCILRAWAHMPELVPPAATGQTGTQGTAEMRSDESTQVGWGETHVCLEAAWSLKHWHSNSMAFLQPVVPGHYI